MVDFLEQIFFFCKLMQPFMIIMQVVMAPKRLLDRLVIPTKLALRPSEIT